MVTGKNGVSLLSQVLKMFKTIFGGLILEYWLYFLKPCDKLKSNIKMWNIEVGFLKPFGTTLQVPQNHSTLIMSIYLWI